MTSDTGLQLLTHLSRCSLTAAPSLATPTPSPLSQPAGKTTCSSRPDFWSSCPNPRVQQGRPRTPLQALVALLSLVGYLWLSTSQLPLLMRPAFLVQVFCTWRTSKGCLERVLSPASADEGTAPVSGTAFCTGPHTGTLPCSLQWPSAHRDVRLGDSWGSRSEGACPGAPTYS